MSKQNLFLEVNVSNLNQAFLMKKQNGVLIYCIFFSLNA